MTKHINISLIDRIRKPIEGNRFLNGLLTFLTIIFFPIILVVGLLLMIFAGILSFFQKLIMSKDEKEKMNFDLKTNTHNDQWTIWTTINGLKIFQKFEGEIRFGPAYFALKSDPTIRGLQGDRFGDWFFQYQNGIFLQKWNSIDRPNTNLLFVDSDTRETLTIEKNIPSVLWNIIETVDKTLELKCDTGQEIITYKIDIKKSGS